MVRESLFAEISYGPFTDTQITQLRNSVCVICGVWTP
jgi:hypothetical protein